MVSENSKLKFKERPQLSCTLFPLSNNSSDEEFGCPTCLDVVRHPDRATMQLELVVDLMVGDEKHEYLQLAGQISCMSLTMS